MNIFASSPYPDKSANGVDVKRLAKMCLEAYQLMSSAVQTNPSGALKKIKKKVYPGIIKHPAATWVGADRLHFLWLLAHARALNENYQIFYQKREACKPHQGMYDLMVKAAEAFPTSYPKGTPLHRIKFQGWFNYDEFKTKKKAKNPKKVKLPEDTSIHVRYRLSLLHKWLYEDARTTEWCGYPPLWAYNQSYKKWLRRVFGKPVNKVRAIKPSGFGYHVVMNRNGQSIFK